MRPTAATMQGGWPRPGRATIALLIINLVAYVLELILMRSGVPVIETLALTPIAVFQEGRLWQPITYVLLHAPNAPGHLLMNMFTLYMFGAPLERWWGGRRVVTAYVICAMAGALFTVAIAGLSLTPVLSWLIPGFAGKTHLGASGATLGLCIAWGTVFAKQEMQFFLLGRMTGRTFMLIVVGIELLVALSFDGTSSTSHFGGMIGGYLLVSGAWRPSTWSGALRKSKLVREKRRIERELRVIEGGKGRNGGGSDGSDLPN